MYLWLWHVAFENCDVFETKSTKVLPDDIRLVFVSVRTNKRQHHHDRARQGTQLAHLREVGDGEATGDAQGGRRRHARGEECVEDTGKYKLYKRAVLVNAGSVRNSTRFGIHWWADFL